MLEEVNFVSLAKRRASDVLARVNSSASNAKISYKNQMKQGVVFVVMCYATIYALPSVKNGNTLISAQAKSGCANYATSHASDVPDRVKPSASNAKISYKNRMKQGSVFVAMRYVTIYALLNVKKRNTLISV